jgi:hypothetical protein
MEQSSAQPSSKDVERLQAELRSQAGYHTSIVDGIADCAGALNDVASQILELPIGEEIADPINALMEGLGKILQGFSDIYSSQVSNLNHQADGLTLAIEHLRSQESGIIIPELKRTN